MNISTGGPHILIFERDQQLAVLLTSEFQLAGYECHTARTAVEVFDAIARHPIKIVLVNVAQAAAARREFWVALDSQRRGRGVQVLTFRCTNIAGYGPHDPEDRSQQAMVDIEIDGMLGIMGMVDTVRARIPGNGLKTNTGTVPRMPRMTTPPPPVQQTPSAISRAASMQQPSQVSPTLNSLFANNAATRPSINDTMQVPPRQPPPVQPPTSAPMTPAGPAPLADMPLETTSGSTSTYTDKIRAVLYPNQRVWTPQGTNSAPPVPESKAIYDPSATTISPSPLTSAPAEATTLQRLASGQIGMENPHESGLAQLSRMLQERQSQQNPEYLARNNYSYPATEPQQSEQPFFPASTNSTSSAATTSMNYATPAPARPIQVSENEAGSGSMNYASPSASIQPAQALENAPTINYTPPPARPAQVPENPTISAQPLRASPIQDIPVERPASVQSGENGRRPESPARAPYTQSTQAPAATPPLASIATPPPASTLPESAPQPAEKEKAEVYITEEPEEKTLHHISGESTSNEKVKSQPAIAETAPEESPTPPETEIEIEMDLTPNNAMLLDIMKSLPPMPPTSPQTSQVQQQVLNGRATRTLGSVLLEGHLVPQNRLEVAQRIQRMLRGVDLNYQLGEILLMFKLLTPDQLLAASLVSYGMITTAQISSLGRIRQELHSIGLEYDLENLLILFRILTPEQLREVRSSWQG